MKQWLLALVIALGGMHWCQAQTQSHTWVYDGNTRTYELFVPESFDPDQPAYLLMVLHGGGQTAAQMMALTEQRFNDLMAEVNGIVVYPDGLEQRWHDGRIRNDGREKVDDAGFLAALIDKLAEEYAIVDNRAYVTGISNGGLMTYRLACEYPDRVAAIAPVAGLYAATLDCTPAHPLPVMTIVGDEDPIIKLDGGDMFYGEWPIGTMLSLEETLDLWQEANTCVEDEAEPTAVLNADPDDDTQVTVYQHTQCTPPIDLYLVQGGGHTWPGVFNPGPEDLVGRTSYDIDATEVIVTFFRENGLADPVEKTE